MPKNLKPTPPALTSEELRVLVIVHHAIFARRHRTISITPKRMATETGLTLGQVRHAIETLAARRLLNVPPTPKESKCAPS